MAEPRCLPYDAYDATGERSEETGLRFTHAEGAALSLYTSLRAKGISSQLRFNKVEGTWIMESDPAHVQDARVTLLELLSQERMQF